MSFDEIVLQHIREYPLMQPTDAVKLAYQSEFGPAHMVSDVRQAEEWIERERREAEESEVPLLSRIGGGYVRLNLNSREGREISSGLLARVFAASADRADGRRDRFLERLEIIRSLAAEGAFQFSSAELDDYLAGYQKEGYPPVSHSSIYKASYGPSYRVIRASYGRMIHILASIERLLASNEKTRVLVAIDGHAAAGKTTLAEEIASVFECNVFHMDDFFLPPSLRTEERLSEPGENIHHERFLSEILLPLSRGEAAVYGVYDCSLMRISHTETAEQKRLNIIEGSYSHHPRLSMFYDLRIFADISEEEQMERILKRNGPEMAKKFKELWIPMENRYFSCFEIKKNSHAVL